MFVCDVKDYCKATIRTRISLGLDNMKWAFSYPTALYDRSQEVKKEKENEKKDINRTKKIKRQREKEINAKGEKGEKGLERPQGTGE